MGIPWSLVILAPCLVASVSAAGALTDLTISPSEVHLSGKQDRQSLVVQAAYADGVTRDVTDKMNLALADKSLARLDGATLYPLADGHTELTVKFDGRTLKVPIVVEHANVARGASFKLDVVPALTKAGCNAGACHGASRGKDGFRLSLFGYDPDGDYTRLTREQIGRRVNLAIPEESLVLEKGLGIVNHTGGERFKKDSELYRTVLQWIQDGAPWHAPALQPALVSAGMTSSLKLVARSTLACSTVIGTLSVRPSNFTVSSVVPSASGCNVAPSSRTRDLSASASFALSVTSRVTPSA